MSSPPAAPKPKRGQRQLLGGSFNRLQPRSSQQSQQRLDRRDSPLPTDPSTEGTGFAPGTSARANTKLELLNPAKPGAYDSSLAIDINRRGCTRGTRLGVLAGLNDWLYGSSSSICWMNGMAGTGKTAIAYTFCELAEEHKILAASFFCTRNSADCRRLTRIVPTIAYQLAHYSASYRSALEKVLVPGLDIGSKNVSTQFELLLKLPLQEVKDTIPGHSVVVIDALDECEDRNGIGLILDTLIYYASDIPLKFLVTSRPDREIYTRMSLHQQAREVVHLDEIEKSLVQADIEYYLKDELAFVPFSPTEMEHLVQRSGTLFIYAATIVRYIASGKRSVNPHKRLWSIIGAADDMAISHSPVDALYAVILKSALEAGDREDVWMVLRTVLLAQEPVNVATIVALAGIEDPQRVLSALDFLRSVVNYPRTTGLVSTFHASFADFMFDNQRAGAYFCDTNELSDTLAQRCFQVMKEQLRFNICNLETSFVPDDEVNDIRSRVNNMIPSSLAYTCRYWANYLSSAEKSNELLEMLDGFLCNQLLFWMEVLSLRKDMVVGIEGLLKIKQWLDQEIDAPTSLVLCIEDARNFVTGFAASPGSQSTPHIYISALPFCPRSSLVYKNYWKRTQGLLELNGSLMEYREAIALATWTFTSNILSLACSPQGDRVVLGCFDKTVRILNTYDGVELVGPLRGHTELVHSVAFSLDGRLVASGSYDGAIRVWNADNGLPICVAYTHEIDGHICHINSVSFSPDARRVVSGSAAGTVRVWDANDGTLLLGPLAGHSDWIRSAAFSPDGALIASTSDDKTIRLWHSQDGTPALSPLQGHNHWVLSVAFSPDGTRLASGSRDQTVRVWNISDGSLISNPFEGHKGSVYSVVISPDGTRVASGSSDGTVRVWNILDGTVSAGPFKLVDYSGSVLLVTSVAFSVDGTRVVSSSYNREVHVWDVRYGDELLVPPSPLSPLSQNAISSISSLAFPPEGTRILSSSTDGTIRLWDSRNGSFIISPEKGQLPSTSLSPFIPVSSPDGRYFASSFEDGVLKIISAATGIVVVSLTGVDSQLSAFRFSQDSSAVITGGRDGKIQVWDLQTGNLIGSTFIGHIGAITAIAQSFDGSLLASYSKAERSLRIWDMLVPILDLDYENSSLPSSSSARRDTSVYDGWRVTKDGWVVDDKKHLLFWLPADIAPVWQSPYALVIITEHGTLRLPKQKLMIGSRWSGCYIPS